MSKNVAVFVDVANIFYAAKAAGVDIDYVTLLKSATAGRDFVRAYAYTGLDPENENQRQFHNFLARSGYKVISKDIRKYGDGRIKANLDIELVVDMMKTARNLDIAVVVSGDGDFAPAIRAVQEQGVRVEVISFRGNTSSDLIDVADQFTDIAQIARVDKSSGRSGRRVAAEGDLSMTEVPDKETEGAPRRRRGRARDERVEAEASGELVVLPGERLSRAGEGEDDEPAEADEGFAAASTNGREATPDEARRRRRRRGGRGRGRSRRDEELVATGATAPPEPSGEEDDDFEDLPPAQPPHHTFGSVWDSQLGVPTAAMPPAVDALGGAVDEDDEEYDEPEVPEYLLAERRQRGQRPGRGARPQRGRSAYQAALDRERYGRTPAQPGFSAPRGPDRGRERDRARGGRPQGSRPVDRAPRTEDRVATGPRSSTEPWSEVPPELEELLRAELARKQPANGAPSTTGVATAEPADTGDLVASEVSEEPAPVAPKPARRRRAAPKASAAPEAADAAPEADTAAVQPADAGDTPEPAKPARRRRTTKATPAGEPTEAPAGDGEAAGQGAAQESDEAPKKPVRRRRTTAASAPAEEG